MQPGSRPDSQRGAKGSPASILWLSAVAFLICCFGWFAFALRFPETAWDFTGFYVAGHLPLRSLYDQSAVGEYGRTTLAPIGVDYYPPYVRPAIFSLLFRTVTWLPYWKAFQVWAAFQFGCYLAVLWVLYRRFRFPIELLAGFGLFYPAMFGVVTGQDALAVTLLLLTGLVLLVDGKDAAAGVVLAGGLYKFNLLLGIPVLLLIKRRYRALIWFAAAGTGVLLPSVLLSSPQQYLELLRNIPRYAIGFTPQKMIGLRGLAHSLGMPGLYYPLAAAVVVATLIAVRRLQIVHAFCVVLSGGILCAYHVTWYDCTLLLIPIVVAFHNGRAAAKASASALLFLFPLWAAFSKTITLLVGILFVASALGAVNESESELDRSVAAGIAKEGPMPATGTDA